MKPTANPARLTPATTATRIARSAGLRRSHCRITHSPTNSSPTNTISPPTTKAGTQASRSGPASQQPSVTRLAVTPTRRQTVLERCAMMVPEMLITEVKPPSAPAAALASPKVSRVWFGSRWRPSASSRLAASVSRMTARNTTSMARVGDARRMAPQSTAPSWVQMRC